MMLPCLAESGTRAILAECWSFGAYRVDALSQARDLHSTMVSDRFAKIAGGLGHSIYPYDRYAFRRECPTVEGLNPFPRMSADRSRATLKLVSRTPAECQDRTY
jgi:hypothetical protein